MRVAALVMLARLWGEVKYTHPWFATKAVDWDRAAIEAIESKEDLRPTVERMLAHLHDPATRLVSPSEKRATAVERTAKGVVRLIVGDGDPDAAIAALRKETPAELVVDVRGMGRPVGEIEQGQRDAIFAALEAFAPRALVLPTSHRLLYNGFPAQAAAPSDEYGALQITGPARTVAAGKKVPLVFVGDERSALPPLALALKAAGAATLVGPISGDAAVKVKIFPVAEGLTVAIRTEDLTLGERWPEAFAVGRDDPYPAMSSPTLPYRLLAVFRFWNIMHFFHPYLSLADDWDAALPRFLAAMENVPDARGYALAVASMAAALHDGHASVAGSPALRAFFGEASPPVDVRPIEGQLVVVRAPSGPRVGDVITAVDGHPVAEVLARLAPYVAASTAQQKSLILARRALRGPRGSTVTVTAGKDFILPRNDAPIPPDPSPRFKVIGDVGYADLTRLELDEVPAMFKALQNTRAIIFDMRGYPHATGWSIAARLNVRGARHVARFAPRQIGAGVDARLEYFQDLPPAGGPLYRGKTVMLIDERAVSQSEHTGLFFKAVAGTTFVGSPTSGTNGDVTNVVVPGGLVVSFSGQEIRNVDGTQLQGVGLRPDVPVNPTIEGVRAGRDEVLERALTYLKGK